MADDTRKLAPLFTWRSAIGESTLPSTCRHVLLALSLYMNEKGGSAYPGSARLARDTGLNQRTVKEWMAHAEKHGWIRVVNRGGSPKGGKRLASEYVAVIPYRIAVDNDQWSQTTGGSDVTDRWSSFQRPVVQDHPISSVIASENSGGVASKSPAGCVRCHGTGSFWDGMKQHACAHTLDDRPTPPPWIVDGTSRDEWLNRSSNESV